MKQIKVSVPATSANVGSGFDAVGLAVTLYNTATFEESDKLDISAADGTRIPRGESNLIYRSAKSLFDRVGKRMPPLRIVQTNPIPMARGLGSSSACIIGAGHPGTADPGHCHRGPPRQRGPGPAGGPDHQRL